MRRFNALEVSLRSVLRFDGLVALWQGVFAPLSRRSRCALLYRFVWQYVYHIMPLYYNSAILRQYISKAISDIACMFNCPASSHHTLVVYDEHLYIYSTQLAACCFQFETLLVVSSWQKLFVTKAAALRFNWHPHSPLFLPSLSLPAKISVWSDDFSLHAATFFDPLSICPPSHLLIRGLCW